MPPASDASCPVVRAFDRRDLVAVVHGGEAQARIHAPAVDMHRARAALAVVASFLRSGQMQVLAEAIEQRRARIELQIVLLAVHTQTDWNGAFYCGSCFRLLRYRSGLLAGALPKHRTR